MKIILRTICLLVCFSFFTACERPYKDLTGLEVVDNSFTGNLELTSEWQFSGNNDSGIYSFAWENRNRYSEVLLNSSLDAGEVRVIVNDAKGEVVLNEVLSSDMSINELVQSSDRGKDGMWLITLVFTEYSGAGYLWIDPI